MVSGYSKMVLLARIAIVVCMFICLCKYVSYKLTIGKEKPIEYSMIKQTQTFWRGTNYKMLVDYNTERQLVSITRKMSDSIDIGEMPKLYYNEFTSSIISSYHPAMALNVLMVLVILFLLSFFITKKKTKSNPLTIHNS